MSIQCTQALVFPVYMMSHIEYVCPNSIMIPHPNINVNTAIQLVIGGWSNGTYLDLLKSTFTMICNICLIFNEGQSFYVHSAHKLCNTMYYVVQNSSKQLVLARAFCLYDLVIVCMHFFSLWHHNDMEFTTFVVQLIGTSQLFKPN